MTWNYRIVEYADESGFGIHEVHYDKEGVEKSMTAEAARFIADSPEELRSSLMMAKMDATRRPVFKEPADWAEKQAAKNRWCPKCGLSRARPEGDGYVACECKQKNQKVEDAEE